ncbi:hypothetical protein MKW98_030979 [Papaver atlanticum]|uniref:Ycf49-like protein n=1 Tax=Papaver atlanticum TaxID=357466 RepID=A0AAD4S6Q5_9MAGN|nr:hypothetical protein MKW98_030979 [Papaver atlanticum]
MIISTCNRPAMAALPSPPSTSLAGATKLLSSVPKITHVIQLPQLVKQKLQKLVSYKTSQNHYQQSLSRVFLGTGFALALVIATNQSASAAEFPPVMDTFSSLQLNEPQNALSLPTWAIHVSSVVEWITAMILVWQYGEKSGYESWKGLSWGMVPLLGGAFCACTWHFFYNSESLSILVALQAALTVIGNFTMCIAAFRICKLSQQGPEKL